MLYCTQLLKQFLAAGSSDGVLRRKTSRIAMQNFFGPIERCERDPREAVILQGNSNSITALGDLRHTFPRLLRLENFRNAE